jgi:16S rRNA processing protein RimM
MVCKYLRIGKIVNTQGIKGEIRITPLTDDIARFDDLNYILIGDDLLIRLDIEYVKYHKNFVLLKLKGIDSINDAEKYKGKYILINREDAITLPKGSYFVCDIIGLTVQDSSGTVLGRVTDIISTGSNDVYTVKNDETEIMLPALKSVVKEINIEQGIMVVEIPEGLLE